MWLPILVAAALIAWTADAGAGVDPPPVEVTACGQRVPARTTGFLGADLACMSGWGVILEQDATLDLRGFTLSGGLGVLCVSSRCPLPPCRRLGRCEVRNGTITGTPFGAIAGYRITVRDMTLDGGGVGPHGPSPCARIDVVDSHLNASGVLAGRVELVGSTLVDSCVVAARASLTSSTVMDDEACGVYANSVELVDSHVVGNGLTYSGCGVSFLCGDLVTSRRPKLDATSTCDTSVDRRTYPIASWGVCALD